MRTENVRQIQRASSDTPVGSRAVSVALHSWSERSNTTRQGYKSSQTSGGDGHGESLPLAPHVKVSGDASYGPSGSGARGRRNGRTIHGMERNTAMRLSGEPCLLPANGRFGRSSTPIVPWKTVCKLTDVRGCRKAPGKRCTFQGHSELGRSVKRGVQSRRNAEARRHRQSRRQYISRRRSPFLLG